MKYDLMPISSNKADNAGGICKLFLLPKEWVETNFTLSQDLNEIKTDVVLKAGKEWLEATCLQDSLVFTELQQSDAAGISFSQKLIGDINLDSVETNTMMNQYRFHEFLVKYVSRNGDVKLLGTKRKGLFFSSDLSTGKEYAEKHYYSFVLNGVSSQRAPFYPVV